MALPRIQTAILQNLVKMGHLTDAHYQKITEIDEDLPGEAIEKLLTEEYKISEFQLLFAKGEAFDLAPANIKNCIVNEKSFSKLDKDFCEENKVLPLGFAD